MENQMKDYAGCGAIIYRETDNKVFIAQRKATKSFGAGLWETVGGGIEPFDKDFLACIKREIKEELNVDILSANEFKDYLVRTDSEKTYKIKMFLVTLVSEPKPNPIDFENSGWFSQGDIENLEFISNCKQRLVDYYREYSRK